MIDLSRHETLMARAISVIDSFDDIEKMSEIGAVLDTIAYIVADVRVHEAVLAVRDHVEAARVAAILNEDAPPSWRVQWLQRNSRCSTVVAERIAAMKADEYLALAGDPDLALHLDTLTAAASGFADELDALLAPHADVVAVPDTIPDDWGSVLETTHVGRSWSGHAFEDDCPCPQQPCGLVIPTEDCPEHALADAKTFRQVHRASDCPGSVR